MTGSTSDLITLVQYFLPVNGEALTEIQDEIPESDLTVLVSSCFAAAATYRIARMSPEDRDRFIRRLTLNCELPVRMWMVEAVLRHAEGQAGSIAGVPGEALAEIQSIGLALMTAEYLTRQECEALHGRAAELAEAAQPYVAAAMSRPRTP